MFWKSLAATLLVLGSSLAVGQSQPSADTVPTREEVLKFLEVTQARARIVQMLEGLTKQGRAGAEQGFKLKVPDATPEQLRRVDELADLIFKDFTPDEFIDAVVPIYQKHLSKNDLGAILAFYATPAGQKLLNEMPAIMSESMAAGGDIGRKKLESINLKMEQQIEAIAREEQEKKRGQQKRETNKD